MTGLLITFEGGDGCGKSTQTKRLAEWLEAQGRQTLCLLNHAATPAAAEIKKMIWSGTNEIWSPQVEAFMMNAMRQDMWARLIKPALANNKIIIADRFVDSTTVYQGKVGGVSGEMLSLLHQAAMDDVQPDITFILDTPVDVAFARMGERTLDRSETKGSDFHEKVRQAYLEVAKENPDRCILIDSTQSPDAIFDQVKTSVQQRLDKIAA